MRIGLALPHYDFSIPGVSPIRFEALAEVADAPVGVGAAAVGAGDAQEAGDAVVHAEGVDHVAGV